MARVFYPIPGITVPCVLRIGDTRFLPAGQVDDLLGSALTRPTRHPSAQLAQEDAASQVAGWRDHAVLEVPVTTTGDGKVVFDDADRTAAEAMAVFRFFVRPFIGVNTDAHRFGLVGEMTDEIRQFVVLWDEPDREEPVTAGGWHRIGGTAPLHVGQDMLDSIEGDAAFRFVSTQLSMPPKARSRTGNRVLTAILMISQAFASLDVTQRVLSAAIAVEVLLGDDGSNSSSAAIARRVAFLTCDVGCTAPTGDGPCPYLRVGKELGKLGVEVAARQSAGELWGCREYLRIAAPAVAMPYLKTMPLFKARNDAAHEGRVAVDAKEASRLVWAAEDALSAALRWFAETSGTLADLETAVAAAAR